jgi:kynurenine formamidase
MMIVKNLFLFILLNLLSFSMIAQDRGEGAWWPSIHGADDEAGATNYVTPTKIMEALSLPQEGKVYELGHPYERIQPAYLDRPYRLNIVKRASPTSVSLTEYFTGYIGQMGTQYDALGHQGRFVQNEDGESHYIFYNGFTDDDLIGDDLGADGIQHLGVESMKPIITKGLLIDIAGYKGVRTLSTNYVVTLSDVLETLEWQGMSEDDIEIGDAILFNYGWSVHWGNPAKYNDGYVGRGENQGSPGIYTEVARWLLTKDISIVGADSCCVEVRPNPGTESVHHLLFLEQGIPILENLDLIELANDRTYEFLLIALNERMVGATGSMIRPIAIR